MIDPAGTGPRDSGVAAIVVNWNSGALLERCLAALELQTLPPRRIIVVDNGSSDDSLACCRDRYPGVATIREGRNLGFAAANNRGMRAATDCAWIALLNPDAFPAPDWLEQLLLAARRHPDCAAFGSLLLDARDPGLVDGTGDVYHLSGLVWRRDHGRRSEQSTHTEGEIFSPCAAAALYRNDLVQALGGFDEDFFCYIEDVDLGFRLRLSGYRCRYVPTACVLHMGSAITGKRSRFSVYHGHRNLMWCFAKNMPTQLLWKALPLQLLLGLIGLLVLAARGQGTTALRALTDAIRGLPRMLRKRRPTSPATAQALLRVMDTRFSNLLRR